MYEIEFTTREIMKPHLQMRGDAWHCEGLEHVGHGVTPLEAFQAWHGAVMLAESKGNGYIRDPRGGPKPRGRFVQQAELKSPSAYYGLSIT